jgi:hypothetical protein
VEQDPHYRGSGALILLHKRVRHFHEQAVKDGKDGKDVTPESALLVTIGLKVSDLGNVGLGPIAR